jgi:hypothetical protein
MKISTLARELILCLTGFMYIHMTVPAGSGEILLTGVYQGKDLYINNPHSGRDNQFCIRNIYLNEEIVITAPESSVCRIILSHLKIGEPVNIRIEYRNDCLPVFVNPQVVRTKDPLSFGEIKIDNSGIEWKMPAINGRTLFFIEKRAASQWIILNSLEALPMAGNTGYRIPLTHDDGMNQYRIKAVSDQGKAFFSPIVRYESNDENISFYPKRVSGKITLMEENDFQILDVKGNTLLRGRDREISVEGLNPGIYYLVIGDRVEKFLKK